MFTCVSILLDVYDQIHSGSILYVWCIWYIGYIWKFVFCGSFYHQKMFRRFNLKILLEALESENWKLYTSKSEIWKLITTYYNKKALVNETLKSIYQKVSKIYCNAEPQAGDEAKIKEWVASSSLRTGYFFFRSI